MPAREITARVILCCLVLTAAALHGGCAARTLGKPWLKPPDQWTDAEVNRVWYDSPWVKVKRIERRIFTGPPRPSGDSDPTAMANWDVETEEFRIRWISAHTMCMAESPLVPSSPHRVLCPESGEYRILADPPWTGSVSSEKGLLLHSYMSPQKLRIRLAPNSVEHVIGGKFILRFPKVMPDGRPVVALDETAVEVVVSDGKHSWKVKFKPQEMVGPAGRDL